MLVEIGRRCLTRVRPDGRKEIVATPGGGPNGIAIGPDGKAYVCNNGGFEFVTTEHGTRPVREGWDYSGGRIERIDLESGAVEVLYRGTHEVQLRGPNDIVFDAHGGFYCTDLGKLRHREMDRGAIFYGKADGSLFEEVAFPLVTPNGIGLSPDGNTLYVAETEAARLSAYPIIEPGVLEKQPWPSPHGGRMLVASPGGHYQRFDSLAVGPTATSAWPLSRTAASPWWRRTAARPSTSRCRISTPPTSASAARTCAPPTYALGLGPAGGARLAPPGTAARVPEQMIKAIRCRRYLQRGPRSRDRGVTQATPAIVQSG